MLTRIRLTQRLRCDKLQVRVERDGLWYGTINRHGTSRYLRTELHADIAEGLDLKIETP